jgi:hypothetical protein
MGSPIQILGTARAFARDFPRDDMPKGYLWDIVDFVPAIVDAQLTGRGKWNWASVDSGYGDIGGGIVATFKGGIDKVLVQGGLAGYPQLLELVPPAVGGDPATATWLPRGTTWWSVQNPVQLREEVYQFDAQKLAPPHIWKVTGAPVVANSAHKFAPVGTTWQETLITGGAPGEEHVVRGANVNVPDLTDAASFDNAIRFPTDGQVTALQGMRTVLLVFHPSSVQRIRGGPLPNTVAEVGDEGMVKDVLFPSIGCVHPKSIATWNDNCIWASSHGIHITDGATVKSLTSAGGISSYWRLLYEGASSIVATTFLDYYIVSILHPDLRPPLPLSEKHGEDPTAGLLGRPQVPPPPDPVPRPEVPPLPPNLPDTRPPPPGEDDGRVPPGATPGTPYPGGRPGVPVRVANPYMTTLICDLNKKQWFRFSNFKCTSMFSGGMSDGMERMWGGIEGWSRLATLGPAFYPNEGAPQVDGNGFSVRPRFETGWVRLSEEGRKRVRFAYLSYDCRGFLPVTNPVRVSYSTTPTLDPNPLSAGYKNAGQLPLTPNGYSRFRLPVYKFPYGISFYVETVDTTGIFRVYDLGVEAQSSERSRV